MADAGRFLSIDFYDFNRGVTGGALQALLDEVRSMNRFRCRVGPVFALLVVAGCSGDPTESFREGVNLRAQPRSFTWT